MQSPRAAPSPLPSPVPSPSKRVSVRSAGKKVSYTGDGDDAGDDDEFELDGIEEEDEEDDDDDEAGGLSRRTSPAIGA
jgi:hypothetical protein